MREIHDAQYAENQRQADTHQGINAADKDARDDELSHVLMVFGSGKASDARLKRRASDDNSINACPKPSTYGSARASQGSAGTPARYHPSSTARHRSMHANSALHPSDHPASRSW